MTSQEPLDQTDEVLAPATPGAAALPTGGEDPDSGAEEQDAAEGRS